MKSSEKPEPTESEQEDAPDHGALGAFLAERAIQIGFLACLVGAFGLIFTSGGEEKPEPPRIVQTAQGTRSAAVQQSRPAPNTAQNPARDPAGAKQASALRRPGDPPAADPAVPALPPRRRESSDSPASSTDDLVPPPPNDAAPDTTGRRLPLQPEQPRIDTEVSTKLADAQAALSSESPYSRAGGIKAYGELMESNPAMRDGILNRIIYFVAGQARRDTGQALVSGDMPESFEKTSPDLHEAIRIIGRRDSAPEKPGGKLMVNWDNTDLRGARMDGMSLVGVSFKAANLAFAGFAGADLTRARLNGALLAHADLSDAVLRGADMTGTDLTGAKLPGADLTGVLGLTQPQLDAAVTDDATVVPDGLQNPEVARRAEQVARMKAEQEEMRRELAERAEAERKRAEARKATEDAARAEAEAKALAEAEAAEKSESAAVEKAAAEKAAAEKAAAEKAAAEKAAAEKAAAEKAAAEKAARNRAFEEFMQGQVSAVRAAGPAALTPADLQEAVRRQAIHDWFMLEAHLASRPG